MSIEAFVIAATVEEGNPKKAWEAGITPADFVMYEEEWTWIVTQTEAKRKLNWRRFQQAFPDFERVILDERIQDLCDELKRESSYMQFTSALNRVADELTPDNTEEMADFLREVIADVLRVQSPSADIILSSDYKDYLKRMKELQALRETGVAPGIPTGIKSLDNHWSGLCPGRGHLVLGRPGDAKSFFIEKLYVEAFLDGRIAAMFSPEMNEDEHRARIATLLTADPRVQEALGIKKALRNRALLDGHGYPYKVLKRLWEWVDEQPGAMILFTNKYRRQKMTPGFVDARADDLGAEILFIDPIYKMKPNVAARHMAGWEKIQAITDDLMDIAQTHSIPLVMTNQAHRQQGNRGDAPHKDSSFNGDSPAQEAAFVVGVKHISEEKKLILRCTKSRFGQDFRVDLKFLPNIGMMEDVSRSDFNYYNGHEDGSDDMKKRVEELEREMGHDRR